MEETNEKKTKSDLKDGNQRPSGLGYGGRDIPKATSDGHDEES